MNRDAGPVSARARNKQLGITLTLLGVICFSSKGIFAKLAYAYGVDPITLMTLRMAIAMPLFLILLVCLAPAPGTWTYNDLRRVVLAGLVGYYVAQLLDLYALQTVSATLGRLILFTYPCFVVLMTAILNRRLPTIYATMPLLLSYVGLSVAVLGGGADDLRATWLGVGLMVLSAILFASYYVVAGGLSARFGTLRFSAVIMTAAGVVTMTHFIVTRPVTELFLQPGPVYVYAGALAIGVTVLPLLLIVEGLRHVGTETSAH